MRKRTHTHSDFIADILSVPQASKDTCFSMKQIYSKKSQFVQARLVPIFM